MAMILACQYTGVSKLSSLLLDYLQTQKEPWIPGRVDYVTLKGSAFIDVEFDLEDNTGSIVEKFIAKSDVLANININNNDYVRFTWKHIGTVPKEVPDRKQLYPKVEVIEKIQEREYNSMVTFFTNLNRFAKNLKHNNISLEELKSYSNMKPEEAYAIHSELIYQNKKLAEQITHSKEQLDRLNESVMQINVTQGDLSVKTQRLQKKLEQCSSELENILPQLSMGLTLNIMPSAPKDPKNLAAHASLNELDQALGILATPLIRRTAIIAGLTSMLQGRLMLLDGPVGTGKTTIAEALARVWGGSDFVIPVRPSWVEPADLLGFYDPLGRIFRPGPFTEGVSANQITDRSMIVIIDELNLARIENYGADILSRIERSATAHQRCFPTPGIPTWSRAEYHALQQELQRLDKIGENNRTPEQDMRTIQLQASLRYLPDLLLPQGILLVGTLNTDDTTYDISPKVIDRSFALTFPYTRLEKIQSQSVSRVPALSVKALNLHVQDQIGNNNLLIDTSELTQICNEETMAAIGVPYSHRVTSDLAVFSVIADHLGVEKGEALWMFIFSRLLPRIRFFKSDSTTDQALNLIQTLRNRWSDDKDEAWKSILSKIQNQCENRHCSSVRFWGGETS
jgi:hypothetical protein